MISIKIQCGCGQKYSFDIEPVNGRMPVTVQCPACGADGTDAANQIIVQKMSVQTPGSRLSIAAAAHATATPLTPRESHEHPVALAVASPTPRKIKWLIPAAVMVVVLSCVAGGFFLWQLQTKNSEEVSIAETASKEKLEKSGARKSAPEPSIAIQNLSLADALKKYQSEEMTKTITQMQQRVKNGGHIVVGQLVLDGPGDPAEVMMYAPITSQGFFAAPVADSRRPLEFRYHGYAPLDVDLQGQNGEVLDLGVVHMKLLPPEKLCQVTGRVEFADNENPQNALVRFTISVSSGHMGRKKFAAPIAVSVNSAGEISAMGFSPCRYSCHITCRGYAPQFLYFEFKEGEPHDLGTITMEKAKKIKLEYVVSKSKSVPFNLSQKKRAEISAGENQNDSALRFQQKNGVLTIYPTHGPSYITDLGAGTLSQIAKNIRADSAMAETQNHPPVVSGHVYLMKVPHQWVLFRMEIPGYSPPTRGNSPADTSASATETTTDNFFDESTAQTFPLSLLSSNVTISSTIRSNLLNWYRPNQLFLTSQKPSSVRQVPAGLKAPFYGVLPIGPKDKPVNVTVILDEGGDQSTRLFVDANGNGNLQDDPSTHWEAHAYTNKDGVVSYSDSGGSVIQAKFENETLPMRLVFYLLPVNKGYKGNKFVSYYRDYARKGEITLGGKKYEVVLSDESGNCNFLRNRGDKVPVALSIDTDGDGEFQNRESYVLGEPFNIGGVSYLARVTDAQGSELQIALSSKNAVERKSQNPGEQALSFSAKTVSGKTVRFPQDFKGRIVQLSFMNMSSDWWERSFKFHQEAYEKFHSHGFELLGVFLDNKSSAEKVAEFTKAKGFGWTAVYDGGWSGPLRELFSASNGSLFIVDGDSGLILANNHGHNSELGGMRLTNLVTVVERELNAKKTNSGK